YFSILDNEILIKNPEKPVRVKDIKGEIKFDQVSFKYPDDEKDIIDNINLDIKSGESVAFVGRSGTGKTTMIKLLLRFYDVNKGRILIDGIDIRNLTKSQLRSFVGIVPQEPILFNNTIGFNIGYGDSQAKKADIIEVARIANLHDFINSLPQKYNTQVGERGIKLSGGQKQRLAIARMLLTNPKIIIFDEATSNLDSESERLIQEALWKIAKDRTVLIIAHRFSTLRRADKIIVMDKGQIIESGDHNKLIRDKGLYSYLWELQSKGQNEILD
ncbi:ATP-binding cassette domain-containing protein, partial [Patescibacteria group bacterium]|nr:ATP-binding cassette domain-containing protein [Patescibacteria group bacterium]